MLATLGDLVEDVVVRLETTISLASDTPSKVIRRRGGSAANVAAIAASLGRPTRFLGQVGTDAIGTSLIADLAAAGVDTSAIRRVGTTATIVVLVEPTGERSMLTDRRACEGLDHPQPRWLDDVDTLHVPLYSLASGPLSHTAMTLIEWANERDIAVSLDTSSVSLIEGIGSRRTLDLITACRPAVVFANADEARSLGIVGAIDRSITVVKHGARPALVHRPGLAVIEVEAIALPGTPDSTGAGDAFAAGFLSLGARTSDDLGDTAAPRRWEQDPVAACLSGHHAAAELLRRRILDTEIVPAAQHQG